MIIQIYEVNNPEEAKKLAELGVNHIGVLVGKGKYPRELNFDKAAEIFKVVPREVKKVAMSLEWNLEEIIELVEKTNPNILHLATVPERLSPVAVKKLKERFPELKFIRTIPVIDDKSIDLAKEYDGVADYLLLDSYKTGDSQVGATGETHNWDISRRIVQAVKIPVILAGGLSPDNVAEAIKKVRPAGVDSMTKTNRDDGRGKDVEKVRKFVETAKSVETLD